MDNVKSANKQNVQKMYSDDVNMKNNTCFFEYTGRFYTFDGAIGNTHGNATIIGSIPLLPGPVVHLAPGGKLVFSLHNKLGN